MVYIVVAKTAWLGLVVCGPSSFLLGGGSSHSLRTPRMRLLSLPEDRLCLLALRRTEALRSPSSGELLLTGNVRLQVGNSVQRG